MSFLKHVPVAIGVMLIGAACGGAAAPTASPSSAPGSPAKPAASSSAASAKPAASASAAAKPAASASAAAKPAASASAAASGQVTKIKMPYTSPSGVYTPYWVAADRGIFIKHGLDLSVSYMDTNAVPAALISGEIDVSPTPSALNIMLSGGDAVFIANLVSAPVFSLYAVSGVDSVTALKGKVIGDTPRGSAPDLSLRALLDKEGLNPETDVKYIFSPDPSTIVAAMQSGQAAAGILSAPSTLKGKDAGFKELANTGKEGVPGLHSSPSVKKSTLAQRRGTWLALLEAFKEATTYAQANPEDAKKIIGKYTKTDPGPALDEAYNAFKPYWQVGPMKAADISSVLKYSSNQSAAAGFDPNKAFDNSIVDQVK